MYEITIITRDRNGEPVPDAYGEPKKKTFTAKDGYDLWKIWNKNSVNIKKSKKRKDLGAAKQQDVRATLKTIDSYIEKIHKKRKKFDDEER